jgi:hypothetical protein
VLEGVGARTAEAANPGVADEKRAEDNARR